MRYQSAEYDEILKLIGTSYNPFDTSSLTTESIIDEMATVYNRLVAALSEFGEEGDYYGISDFAVRPDFSIRHIQVPSDRQLTITVLTEDFHRSDYLVAAINVLRNLQQDYRIWIDQDFDPRWIQTILVTRDLAQTYCNSPSELDRLTNMLSRI